MNQFISSYLEELEEVSIVSLSYCILFGQIKGYNSSITTIIVQEVVIELWLDSYRTVVPLIHFYQRNTFVLDSLRDLSWVINLLLHNLVYLLPKPFGTKEHYGVLRINTISVTTVSWVVY